MGDLIWGGGVVCVCRGGDGGQRKSGRNYWELMDTIVKVTGSVMAGLVMTGLVMIFGDWISDDWVIGGIRCLDQ